MPEDVLDFRILGPLEVSEGPRRVTLGGPRQHALLACLLIHRGAPVAADWLVEQLWKDSSGDPPAALQVAVSRLRKALRDPNVIRTQARGYMLEIAPEQLDAARFALAHSEGSRLLAAGETSAAAVLREALAMWRGPPLADFRYEPFAQGEIARLGEARLDCLAERIEADLALGQHAKLIGELESLTAEHPLQERLRRQLMLALYRSGRQADALEVYQAARQHLIEELGIEPGGELRELHQAILRQDAELDLPRAPIAVEPADAPALGAEAAAPSAVVRKTVTVLVTGIGEPAGAAALDPEVRRRLDDRTLTELAPVLERHGATVERLPGGRVLAVFGVPAAHEDDALRAVRAAIELRDAFADRPEMVRTGIDSGEVLTGDTVSGGPLVTGNAVESAAALQEASAPREILMGVTPHALVREAVTSEPVDLGDGRPQAWRLGELVPGAPPFLRRFDAPLVGRGGELSQLRQAFERAMRERRAQLFTVFGEAGIGKTRLAAELAGAVAGEAQVLTGRCLSYDEGITYWPVREIVAQAAGGREVRELLGDDRDADAVAERLDSAVGTGTSGAVGEEVFWAVRKLAETLAQDRPLLLVFEDVHWGEPTLLDLIEHLADWIHSAPVLILCLARPELLDGRPSWGGGKLNATSILLEPLSKEESTVLIGALAAGTELSPQTSRRITDAADGNPLFLEQMLAMLAEDDEDAGPMAAPPAIQALLASRLDRLEPKERRALERASVEGEIFHLGAVVDLSPPEAQDAVASQLMSLVRKELIRPGVPTLPGEEAFGFRHALIRDAAYASLPKEARTDLHERYAGWLERALGNRVVEGEEFLAYHLEQAHRYRVELGDVDESTAALAARAGDLFASAGRRAFMRGDWPATVNLWERALALLAEESTLRRGLMPDLSLALFQSGSMERADAVAGEAMAAADAAGDRAARARAAVTRTYYGTYLRADRLDVAAMRREAEQAFAIFDELDDDAGRTRAIFNIDIAEWASGNADEFGRAAERAIHYARRAGIRPDELEVCAGFSWSMCWGTTPASVARQRIEEVVLGVGSDRSLDALAAMFLALLDGMENHLDEARERMDGGRRTLAEVGLHYWYDISSLLAAQLAMLATDFELAERMLREVLDRPGTSANRWLSTFVHAELAHAAHAQQRHDDSFDLTEEIEVMPPLVDVYVRTRCRGARAVALGSIGRLDEAEALARKAVDLSRQTDCLNLRGDTLVDLAEILAHAGRPDDPVSPLRDAAALYERKGNVVSAAKAQTLLAELQSASP